MTRILIAMLLLAAPALAQNRIASGGTYHGFTADTDPYTCWTNSVGWYTTAQNPSNLTTWTVESFGNEGATRNDGRQTNVNSRPVYSSGRVQFDGIDDHYYIADADNLTPVSNLTVMLRFNATTLPTTTTRMALVGKHCFTRVQRSWYLMIGDNTASALTNSITFYTTSLVNSSAAGLIVNTPKNMIAANKLYHVAATYAKDNVSIYINGVLATNSTSSTISDFIANNTEPAIIGKSDDGGISLFQGTIDSVRIYGMTMTSQQVYNAAMMEAGKP